MTKVNRTIQVGFILGMFVGVTCAKAAVYGVKVLVQEVTR